jgi:hypothetical protein
MGVASRIQNDAVCGKAYLLNFVDQLALHVALEVGKLDLRKLRLKLGEIAFKGFTTVYFWLSLAKQVEIRAIDHLDFHAHIEKN